MFNNITKTAGAIIIIIPLPPQLFLIKTQINELVW